MGSCSTKLDLGDLQLEASSDPATTLLNLQLHYSAYNAKSQVQIDNLTKKYLEPNIPTLQGNQNASKESQSS